LQKVKTYFLANIYQALFESHQVLKIEGPYCSRQWTVGHVQMSTVFTTELSTWQPLPEREVALVLHMLPSIRVQASLRMQPGNKVQKIIVGHLYKTDKKRK
jgi:hypothetical protein